MSAVVADHPASPAPSEAIRHRNVADMLATVSASRLGLWLQCRLKFWFRYLSGIVKPKTAALHLGSSVHETLRLWNRARWQNQPLSLKQLHDAYSSAWNALQESEPVSFEATEEAQMQSGWRILETYFRESPIQSDEKPEAVEVSVEADLAKHGLPKLVGVIDLVRPGGRIVDFKTASKSPDPELVAHTTEIQTTGYALLYRQATGHRESGIELHHLIKTKSPRLVVTPTGPATQSQETRLMRAIESYVAGLEREDFVPSPGMQCAGCEFFNECRAWKGGPR